MSEGGEQNESSKWLRYWIGCCDLLIDTQVVALLFLQLTPWVSASSHPRSSGTVGVDLLPPKATREQDSLAERVAALATGSTGLAVPFQFLNLGILAYTGAGSALAQVQLTPNPDSKIKGSGPVGFGIWRR